MNKTAEEFAIDLARWLTKSEDDAQAMLASFRQGKPPRRLEFGKRGLAGYVEDMQAAGHPVTIGVDVLPAAFVVDIGRDLARLAPDLPALACDECSRALVEGETRFCSDCV